MMSPVNARKSLYVRSFSLIEISAVSPRGG
jgi:hypothetical protein